MYKVGDKIVIDYMSGEPRYTGREGVITHIDDMGQLHGTWGGLAVIPSEDLVHKSVEQIYTEAARTDCKLYLKEEPIISKIEYEKYLKKMYVADRVKDLLSIYDEIYGEKTTL